MPLFFLLSGFCMTLGYGKKNYTASTICCGPCKTGTYIFFDKHWEIIDFFIWCKFFISIKNIYNTTQHVDVIANHANVWMIQIKRYLIRLLFIWADLQEFCQFIIFALLLEPFWYLLVTVALDQTICGLILEVQSCQYFYCKLGYWYLDLDLMDLHGLFLHCFSFTWSIRGKIYLLPQNNSQCRITPRKYKLN